MDAPPHREGASLGPLGSQYSLGAHYAVLWPQLPYLPTGICNPEWNSRLWAALETGLLNFSRTPRTEFQIQVAPGSPLFKRSRAGFKVQGAAGSRFDSFCKDVPSGIQGCGSLLGPVLVWRECRSRNWGGYNRNSIFCHSEMGRSACRSHSTRSHLCGICVGAHAATF